jgi:DNA invertase Pin-like site-specific DNA recombinase
MAIDLIRDLGRRGVHLRSLTEPFLDVDISTPMGEAVVAIMAVLAQLRVATIRENTRRGLAHARAQGRVGGRPSVMTPERTAAAVQMREHKHSIVHIAKVLGVGKSSVSRALAKHDEQAAASRLAALGTSVPVQHPGLGTCRSTSTRSSRRAGEPNASLVR